MWSDTAGKAWNQTHTFVSSAAMPKLPSLMPAAGVVASDPGALFIVLWFVVFLVLQV